MRDRIPLRNRHRRGVTLLEVMFSIGVVVVGLLGVIALLPLAGAQAQRGLTADRASAVGSNAVHEFVLRGMAQPQMWTRWFPTDLTTVPPRLAGFHYFTTPGGFFGGQNWQHDLASNTWTYSPPYGEAFCLDPRFMGIPAHQNDIGNDFPWTTDPNNPNAIFKIPRYSLLSAPRALGGGPMTLAHANQIFTSHDDLSVELPSDRTLLPNQIFGLPGADGAWGFAKVDDDGNGIIDDAREAGWQGSDDLLTRREFTGTISWMATVAPKLDATDGFRDLYTLSIVVFNQRDLSASTMQSVPNAPDNERVANVIFWNGGLAGGEVTLSTRDTNPERPGEDLQVQEGDWLMLISYIGAPPDLFPALRWYRVVATDRDPIRWGQGPDNQWGRSGQDDDGDGMVDNSREAGWPNTDDDPDAINGPFIWTRNVTLQGADWNQPDWHVGGSTYYPTQAVLVNGVVAVHEKVIRLEASNPWNQ